MARQDRAERTRNAILDSAAAVFNERGFAGASLSEILTKAGVTKGALYFHFSSKEELAMALIEEQWKADLPHVDFEDVSLQTVIDISHAFAHNIRHNVRVRASNRLVLEANFSRPTPEVYERWIGILAEVLQKAQERGDLRKEWDPAIVADWVSATFIGLQSQSEVFTGMADLHERITIQWKIALPGLVPPRRVSRFQPAGTAQWEEEEIIATA
ncbi:MAG TPA: ScbR family autoregulator-binding transcription factor [Actinophytocola sp.]|uniref:ScbR family autoregulator-binding transcription factor n=1 Tax=Actinophytocola sp. TaxID=1872138 RepID=UPI002F91C15F